MKFILLITIVLMSCSSQRGSVIESGYIELKKIGPSDKPFTTVIISTRNYPPQAFQKVILVDSETFSFLYQYVDVQKIKYDGKVSVDEWFAFEVSTNGNNLIDSFYLPTQEKSIKFFKDLLSQTDRIKDSNEIRELQKELKLLLKRIGG